PSHLRSVNPRSLEVPRLGQSMPPVIRRIPLAVLAFLVGAVLGMRWRVLVLIPTSGSIVAAAIAFDLLLAHAGLAATVSCLAGILFAHQSGSFFGDLMRT